MRSLAALLVVALLVCSSAAGVGAGQADGDRGSALGTPPATSYSTVDNASNETVHDDTTIYVSLRESGDAEWNVTARFALQNENETESFRRLAKDYESGATDAGFTADTFERIVDHAGGDIDRPMTIRNVNRSGQLRNNGSVGLLTLTFTWTNFSRIEEGRVVLGDVFRSESGTWLSELSADQTLVIDGPEGHYIIRTSASGGQIIDTQIRYEGPQSLQSSDLSVTYAPRTDETTTSTGMLPDLSGAPGLLLLILVFGLGTGGVYVLSQRRSADPEPEPASGSGDRDEAPSAAPVPDDEPSAGETEDEDKDDEPDTELLSDEERVLRLLRKNDGRMKQANIVTETNWSNAKVSQLLSTMEENGDVDKLRIGRENLITLPDEDVTDID
ncbi:hypothetical protein BRC82_00925 [Halobacteriales archaeon QS_1_67_19]|nr:MAG: hypothetical protein BRC82_00925 [Halobacteriales archaeon QS_1_67_19]